MTEFPNRLRAVVRVMQQRLMACLVLAIAARAAGEPAPPVAVTSVRFWSLGQTTRIAVETNGEFRYRYERLTNPGRIFFDVIGARVRMGAKAYHTIPVGDPLIRQIRVAETSRSAARVVVDLQDEQAEYSASQLSNPDRLIIEIRRASAAGGEPPSPQTASPSRSPREARPFEPPPVRPMEIPTLPAPPRGLLRPVTSVGEPGLAALRAPIDAMSRTRRPPAESKPATARTATAQSGAEAAPAQRNSAGSRSLTRALGLKVGRVVLDPGHGGHDAGTTGPSGLAEKDIALDIATRLGVLIEQGMGSEVLYTRTEDVFVPLEDRAAFANERKADLFLSIHVNSSPIRSAAGAETYYLNFTTSRASLDVAARENATANKPISELRDLLQKIALQDKIAESREFALKIQDAMQAVSKGGARSKDRGVKKAPFLVLIGASMPAVLAEIGFVSNAREESLFKKPEHRQKIAEALYRGLSQYAETLSHFEVARTPASTP